MNTTESANFSLSRSLALKFIRHQGTQTLQTEPSDDEKYFSHLKGSSAGKRVGMDKYQSILTASKQHMDNEDTRVAGHLYLADPPAAGIWGKVAKKQEKAARKLVRATEMDEG